MGLLSLISDTGWAVIFALGAIAVYGAVLYWSIKLIIHTLGLRRKRLNEERSGSNGISNDPVTADTKI